MGCFALFMATLAGSSFAETARLAPGRVLVTPETLEGCDAPVIKQISLALPGLKGTVNRSFVCKLPIEGRTLDVEVSLWVYQGAMATGRGGAGQMHAERMYKLLGKDLQSPTVQSPLGRKSLMTQTTFADFYCWTLTGEGDGGRTRTLLTCMIDSWNAPVTITVKADNEADAYRALTFVGEASSIELR